MSFKHVLVLAAHPDDEIGCAGLISKMAEEDVAIRLVSFSECGDLNDEKLVDEWEQAVGFLGIKRMVIWDLPNRRLPERRQEILEGLDRYASEEDYDLVLCPTTFDVHQDHSTVTAEAVRRFKSATILGYELPWNAVHESTLTAFSRLTLDQITKKIAHAATYESQSEKPYMQSGFIAALARVRGVQAGVDYAEAYEVIRWQI